MIDSTMQREPAAAGGDASVVSTCAFCRRTIAADDASLTLFRDGVPQASYHEGCRPDRQRSGCSGAGC